MSDAAAARLPARLLAAFAALIAALALAGCAESVLGGFETQAAAGPRVTQVFVVSTRKGESGEAAQQAAPDGPHYALATLTIPPAHRAGALERPMWGSADAASHIALAGSRELSGEEFRAELASHLSGRVGVNRDVLVFVHGFNTGFREARARAAQIVADSGFGGVAVLFTWPSRNELFGYVSDKDSATASRDALQELLQTVAATPGVGKVHVLGHSMGGWLTMEALRQEAIAGHRDLDGRLGQVMLASPDIDMEVFASQMARIRPANVTVFATAGDRALSLSSALANSRPRVGAIDPGKPQDRERLEGLGARVYDLSAYADADRFVAHAIYSDSPAVLAAIGSRIEAPRPEDAGKVSVIDASNWKDPNAPAPAAPDER